MPGTMDFGDFLSKMSGQTNKTQKREVKIEAPPEKERVTENRSPRKKSKTQTPEYIEEKETMNNESRIDEEFMDKAYDYAQGVIKVIRQNFKSTEKRVAMLESLNQAIVYYLQSVGAKPTSAIKENEPTSNLWNTSETMSESEWNNMPKTSHNQIPGSVKMNDLTGQTANIQRPMNISGDYNPSLNLGIKINADGKQEADLSGVTAVDINEMRVLAGLEGPEKEAKDKELAAAKKAVQQQIAEKGNQ